MSQTTDRHEPSPERVETIRRWLVDQANDDAKPVGIVSIALTADNTLTTSEVGIEPVFAKAMLPAVLSLAKRLESLAAEYRPALELVRNDGPVPTKAQARRRHAKVVPLRLV